VHLLRPEQFTSNTTKSILLTVDSDADTVLLLVALLERLGAAEAWQRNGEGSFFNQLAGWS
jgi:hypothetical protein